MVDRRGDLSREDFEREYLVPLRPVILTCGTEGWGSSRWSPAWFQERFADKIVHVDDEPCRLGDFLDEVLASSPERPARYLRNIDLPTAFPELMPYVTPPFPYALPDRLRSPLFPRHFPQKGHFLDLFIGGPAAGFPYIHYDIHHLLSYITQIYGEKEFYLFPPQQGVFLYPNPEIPDESLIDNPLDPDYDRFPLYRQAEPLRFVLHPGETLFMPCGWWHTTRMSSVSITLGFDQLCAANWRAFIGDQYARRVKNSPLKAHALLTYLIGAGAALTAAERAQGIWSSGQDLDFVAQYTSALRFQL